ncbi:hypothetical protein [Nocardia fusca]|uniref:hypothetical protein n=1 Tax=Nocardia fusca TaxID=941183 RepID=UPI0012F483F7|nr:hypothetical protein [Nocardia fusca]
MDRVVEIIGESDWEDQDLLTHDEAGERLRAEVADSEARIAALENADAVDTAELERERVRLDLIKSRLGEIDEALAAAGRKQSGSGDIESESAMHVGEFDHRGR